MDKAQIIEINPKGKYLIIVNSMDSETAARIYEDFRIWLEGNDPFAILVNRHGNVEIIDMATVKDVKVGKT